MVHSVLGIPLKLHKLADIRQSSCDKGAQLFLAATADYSGVILQSQLQYCLTVLANKPHPVDELKLIYAGDQIGCNAGWTTGIQTETFITALV